MLLRLHPLPSASHPSRGNLASTRAAQHELVPADDDLQASHVVQGHGHIEAGKSVEARWQHSSMPEQHAALDSPSTESPAHSEGFIDEFAEMAENWDDVFLVPCSTCGAVPCAEHGERPCSCAHLAETQSLPPLRTPLNAVPALEVPVPGYPERSRHGDLGGGKAEESSTCIQPSAVPPQGEKCGRQPSAVSPQGEESGRFVVEERQGEQGSRQAVGSPGYSGLSRHQPQAEGPSNGAPALSKPEKPRNSVGKQHRGPRSSSVPEGVSVASTSRTKTVGTGSDTVDRWELRTAEVRQALDACSGGDLGPPNGVQQRGMRLSSILSRLLAAAWLVAAFQVRFGVGKVSFSRQTPVAPAFSCSSGRGFMTI